MGHYYISPESKDGFRITEKHVIFWGSFLSNFAECTIQDSIDGVDLTFRSAEQYFMYRKALEFQDLEIASRILQSTTPQQAKRLGRKVKNFNTDHWNCVRETIMEDALMLKFLQNFDIRSKFLDPELDGKYFVEGSPFDIIWGIGILWTHPYADDESKWKGENLLGKALTRVRNIIKNEYSNTI